MILALPGRWRLLHTREEPGLFGRAEEPTAGRHRADVRAVPTDNPNLPVVGEASGPPTDGLPSPCGSPCTPSGGFPGRRCWTGRSPRSSGAGLSQRHPLPPSFNLGLTRLGEGTATSSWSTPPRAGLSAADPQRPGLPRMPLHSGHARATRACGSATPPAPGRLSAATQRSATVDVTWRPCRPSRACR